MRGSALCGYFYMVDRNLIREFDVSEEDWDAAIGGISVDDVSWLEGKDINVIKS